MITVMGASGNVGRVVVEQLLATGEQVRAAGRSPERLASLEAAGAIPVVGDPSDPAFLTGAFRGAIAVQVLMPIDPTAADYLAGQQRVAEAIVTALRASGVRHVVAVSSIGADMAEGTGVVAALHELEQRLRPLTAEGVHVLALRSASYFENFAGQIDLARTHGIVADGVDLDVAVPMIATRDVGTVAAAALRTRDWTGWATRELLGPRDLSYPEATRILGAALGLPQLSYMQLSDADMLAALRVAGVAEPQASLLVELSRGLSDGTVAAREQRSARNTTPTRFEEFAAQLIGSGTA